MKAHIVNINNIKTSSYRFDPSFHLSDAVVLQDKLNKFPNGTISLKDATEKVFLGNIFSRIFVKDAEHGIPYLAASDTVLTNINTGKYLSNSQARRLEYLMLKKDWILVTCSGTIGNVTFTNSSFENHIATHDLIRIIPDDNRLLKGYLYAFLASKYGYLQLTQSKFGGVVKHINADHVNNISIPLLPMSLQEEINRLIISAASCREKSCKAIEDAHKLIEENVGDLTFKKKGGISIKNIINSHNCRFEGAYFVSENRFLYDNICERFEFVKLKDVCSKIFRPGIFKRQYVQNNGITFLGGADILNSIPNSPKQLSKQQIKQLPDLIPDEGSILVTCGGTIGNTVYVDKQLSKCAISQHVIRLVPNKKIPIGYLYAFLSSKYGQDLLKMFTYGSVIPQIEPHHIELLPIPIFHNEIINNVDSLCHVFIEQNELAKQFEIKAIELVEKAIKSL